jgi:hypothetical protein
MDKTLELVLAIMSAVFVMYTAVIDPKASLIVAVVAIVCLVAYRMIFNRRVTKKVVIPKKKVTKKTVNKKSVKAKSKKK